MLHEYRRRRTECHKNFRILIDYANSLLSGWITTASRSSPARASNPFLGTQLVVISRQLGVISETVDEVRFVLDSVFIGPGRARNDRLQLHTDFPTFTGHCRAAENLPPIYLEDLPAVGCKPLSADEAQDVIQNGGKLGIGRGLRRDDRRSSIPRPSGTLSCLPRSSNRRYWDRPRRVHVIVVQARAPAWRTIRHGRLDGGRAYYAGPRERSDTETHEWQLRRTIRDLYDRIAALREQVANRLCRRSGLKSQLADALTKQIDDLLRVGRRRRDQARRRRIRGSPPWPAWAPMRRRISARRASRRASWPTTRPSRRSVSSPSATCTTCISTKRSACSAWCRSCKSCSGRARFGCPAAGRVRALSVRPARGTALHEARQARRLPAYLRIRRRPGPAGSRPNTDFHKLFAHFVHQVTLFWRDKRISDVIRERAYDPSFGSIAIVRRAGLDLRNNMKWLSFGDLNVMRVEVMQLLEEAFRILDSEDVKRLFGADNAWDVVEEVLIRYFNERLVTSPRQRMGVTGREVLRWLAQPHHPQTTAGAIRNAVARNRRAGRRVAHECTGHAARRPLGHQSSIAVDTIDTANSGRAAQYAGATCALAARRVITRFTAVLPRGGTSFGPRLE